MFFKYASNILQSISDKCMLKSFTCQNEADAELYRKIAHRVEGLITRVEVERTLKPASKSDG